MPELKALGVQVWIVGKDLDQDLPLGMIPVDLKTLTESTDPIPRSVRDQQPVLDDSLYIFTSGTTGSLCYIRPRPFITTPNLNKGTFSLGSHQYEMPFIFPKLTKAAKDQQLKF